MHELSMVQSLLEIIDAQAAKHRFRHVNSVKVSFGRISAIDPKALEFAFLVQSRETIAQGASLEMEVLPLTIHCHSCDQDAEMEVYDPLCPLCGEWEIEIKSGHEDLKLIELDVD